ncbi:dirigent protein 21 [Beta vulgaris subsp. vulgaris]|uniref:dirigent protein 21 n=1 Tax=Beta vulgaris subsp. vulgaris TaxID=3555 RepID=UPI002036C04B|nr:dirigent protein 21 [Beta vulgaris subsp. vulgaris]
MSIIPLSFFSVLLLSFFISQTHAFSKPISKEEMGLKQQQNLTHLHFYFHDYVQGANQTALRIAQAPTTDKSPGAFGALVMIDDPLTEGPEHDSKIVGYAQGMYGFADQKQAGLLMVMNYVFVEGEYNGSTLSVLGRNQVMNKVREMAIVGGSGVFRFASGYAQAKTISMLDSSGASVVEYDVYVQH